MKLLGIPLINDRSRQVRIVQQKLIELGFLNDKADGGFGNKTKEAISYFQIANGLNDSGSVNAETLHKLGIVIESVNLTNPINEIIKIADDSGVAKHRWENRGHAPYGYFYGMGLMFARLYNELKLGNNEIVNTITKVIDADPDKDALKKFESKFITLGYDNNTPENRLRNLFALMMGLGLMESRGRYSCGWDKGKIDGWGGKYKKVTPTATNAEAGLFQTSYDFVGNLGKGELKTLLNKIITNYTLSNDGFFNEFADGVFPSFEDNEYFKEDETPEKAKNGLAFQKLSKECPGFAVEFTALALRNNSNHWAPVKHLGNVEKQLEIKVECIKFLELIKDHIDSKFEVVSIPASPITNTELNNNKATLLNLAETLGQKAALQKIFSFAPTSKANFWAVVDFNKPSNQKRLFIFNLREKNVECYLVSHGKNSGGLIANSFSNTEGSNQSSLGIYKTAETYIGNHGLSLRIDGLETDNNNARKRLIVIHEAPYVTDEYAGNSLGCFVINPKYAQKIINNLKGGSYLIAWSN